MIKATRSCISFWLLCVLLITGINARTIKSLKGKSIKLPDTRLKPEGQQESIIDLIKPSSSQNGKLDLAFIMDTTGSMSSYINSAKQNIREIVEEIVTSSGSDNFCHPKNDFTSSVSNMKSWLNTARARGGGDGPEAVADAMFEATRLSWRQDATKISVLISDAPPHGLVPSEDTSFPEDLQMAELRKNCLYGSFKQTCNEKLKQASAAAGSGASIDKQQIAQTVFRKLQKSGAKSKQLVRNNKTLDGPSADAKVLASKKSMAEVRKIFKKGNTPRTSFSFSPRKRLGRLMPDFATKGGFRRSGGGVHGECQVRFPKLDYLKLVFRVQVLVTNFQQKNLELPWNKLTD
ncbi:unnamed protein product [Mytilus edulis]|uniref:Hemicentin-1-like von Willebrand factor A domain-containing protein n=1 Tax=Mytilus edulis TaxID=6550 RepID=A0A8S3Q455_MYTED|nr:unnamed protein product [Mytilus edulis]